MFAQIFPLAPQKVQDAYDADVVNNAQTRFDECVAAHESTITTHKDSDKKNTHKGVCPPAWELAIYHQALADNGTGARGASEKFWIKKNLRLDPADNTRVQWKNSGETVVYHEAWGDRLLVAHVNPETGVHEGRDVTFKRARYPDGKWDGAPQFKPPGREVVQAWIQTCRHCHEKGGKAPGTTKKRKSPPSTTSPSSRASSSRPAAASRPKKQRKTMTPTKKTSAALPAPAADAAAADYNSPTTTGARLSHSPSEEVTTWLTELVQEAGPCSQPCQVTPQTTPDSSPNLEEQLENFAPTHEAFNFMDWQQQQPFPFAAPTTTPAQQQQPDSGIPFPATNTYQLQPHQQGLGNVNPPPAPIDPRLLGNNNAYPLPEAQESGAPSAHPVQYQQDVEMDDVPYVNYTPEQQWHNCQQFLGAVSAAPAPAGYQRPLSEEEMQRLGQQADVAYDHQQQQQQQAAAYHHQQQQQQAAAPAYAQQQQQQGYQQQPYQQPPPTTPVDEMDEMDETESLDPHQQLQVNGTIDDAAYSIQQEQERQEQLQQQQQQHQAPATEQQQQPQQPEQPEQPLPTPPATPASPQQQQQQKAANTTPTTTEEWWDSFSTANSGDGFAFSVPEGFEAQWEEVQEEVREGMGSRWR